MSYATGGARPGAPSRCCARILILLAAAVLAGWPAGTAHAEGGAIEAIEVRGLRRMTKDAFTFASGLRVGQPYDERALRDAYRRLWDRGLFSDLKAEVEPGTTGTIIIFTASERPVIVTIDYDEIKAITRTNIDDRFRERGVELAVGKPVDRRVIARARDTIRDLLGEKGYLDAGVREEITPVSDQSSSVRFRISQGPRTRIREIEFVGNELHSDRRLRSAMKLTREHSIITAMQGKDIYFPAKYDQDIDKVRELYQNTGYLDVEIRPADVDIREARSRKRGKSKGAPENTAAGAEPPAASEVQVAPTEAAAAEPSPVPPPSPPVDETARQRARRERKEKSAVRKAAKSIERSENRKRKWVYLTVRVHEGEQYRLGEITTSGNTLFTNEEVVARVPIRPGGIVNRGLLDAGLDTLRAAYGDRGYIYASVNRSLRKREGNLADVAIEIREDRAYVVDRIEFEGNTTTRDEVLRREMRLTEGGLISKRRLDLSMYKLNQLGFIAPIEDPVLEPVPGTDRVRVGVRTEERGRNEIQIGGGYSGTQGFFFAGSYSTRNFLGRGETLGLSLQAGGRSSRYSLSFTEPYFLGKPITAGFNLFRRDQQFAQNATQSGSGLSLVLGRRIGDFAAIQGIYSFEKNVDFVNSQATIGGQAITTTSSTRVGSFTPVVSYDRINNPFRPSAGRSVSVSSTIAGSYLGGENSYYKPALRGTQFFPVSRKTYLGIHAELGWVGAYGGRRTAGGNILGIPQFERYYLGGDQLGPRIFETRTISPVRFVSRDGARIARNRSEIVSYKGRDLFGQRIEVACDKDFDFTPNDGRCTNGLRQVLVGGNRFALAQFEYDISAGGPFVLAFFVDAGLPLVEDSGWTTGDLRVSAGIEARIYLPVFQAPLRFIFGRPLREKNFDNTNSFQFSIGQSF